MTLPTTYIAVDVDNLQHNVRQVMAACQPAQLMAVVKGDGYGHGAALAAQAAVEAGAPWIVAGNVGEAGAIRAAGVSAPLLVLLPVLADEAEAVLELSLTATIGSLDDVRLLREAACRHGQRAVAHVLLDTGIGRLGIGPGEVPQFVERVREAAEFVAVEGVYMHFASAHLGDKQAAYETEFQPFRSQLEVLREALPDYRLAHAGSSPTLMDLPPDTRLDYLRVGTLLYGEWWIGALHRSLHLKPTWELRSRIVALRTVRRGTPVGYAGEFRARRPTVVATVPVGHSHGLTCQPMRPHSSWRETAKHVLSALHVRPNRWLAAVRGHIAPLIGRVSMDQCCLDVTDVPGVEVGDTVVLPCRRTLASSRIPRIATTL
jgi:alanine racemase